MTQVRKDNSGHSLPEVDLLVSKTLAKLYCFSLCTHYLGLLSPSDSEDHPTDHPTDHTDEIKVLSLKRKLPAAAFNFSLSENDYSEEFSPNDSESTQQVLSPLKGELPAAEAFSPSILKKDHFRQGGNLICDYFYNTYIQLTVKILPYLERGRLI
ncbi:uncharacterized protein LOC134718023 [Mytilus trossulus]|uniref:uncharacterized protein LOC134718023 n=1 Tax=Mytilus trossulus TaxID=6551 RepID=UPI00300742F2